MKRAWLYEWNTWYDSPRFPWWRKWLPATGGDEYGRLTVVLPLPWLGHLVVALWNSCNWRGHLVIEDAFCDRCGLDT